MSSAAEGSVVIIGLSVAAHTGFLANVPEWITSKTQGQTPLYSGNMTVAQFGKWAAAYTGLSVVLIMGSDGDRWGDVFTALAVLIATASLFAYWKDLVSLFGGGPTTATAVPAKTPTPPGGTFV